ncbi:uncharacterized protein LOC132942889 [Metopolophium dirhodum]|uniref:uncharacterized protein LOC132942889 n=1 Tax=Metopolophium dirhodum TaxID=44670 RepID=UPI0029902587|nr:uncharacterized protein LOC132942889 [Metopolophium dirhodum]
MASKFSFTSPEVEKLVHFVQGNPVLYYTLDANYKNISLRDSIWKEISPEIEESVDSIKQIWENIRDSYSKIITRKPKTGSALKIKHNWTLRHRLHFLYQDIVRDQCLTSNTAITEMHDHYIFNKEEGLDDMSNKTEDRPTETFIKNRCISTLNQIEKNVLRNLNKLSTQNQQIQTENEQFSTEEVNQLDDMDMFFQSLSLKAKQFPTNGRIEIKMKISTLMNELQEKYLVHTPPLRPQLMQPIYLNLFTNAQMPSEQNEFSSSSSIQSCISTLPSLHSNSEFSNSESSDDSNSSV